MRNHWKRTSTDQLFASPRLEVHRDQVINPGGQAHPYDHVVFADTVRAVVLNNEGQVLVVDQEHYLPEQRLFQLPGGALGPEEDPQQGAVRELAEETGIHGGQWVGLGSWWPLPAMTSCRAHAFLITEWETGSPAREASEADMELVWMPLEKATAQVECAVSVAALARAAAQ